MAGSSVEVSNIINEALSHLGVYTGDPLDASDLQSAFYTFQSMMDGWTVEPLTIYQRSVLTFSTTAGQQSYTLGVGNSYNWNAAFLPFDIDAATQGLLGTTPSIEVPLAIDTELQWASIAIKSMSSGVLEEMYPVYGPTSHVLSFWPVPSASIPINLYVPQPIAAFSATTNSVVLPPGYLEAITFELAMKLSAKFGASVPEWLPAAMMDAKSKIKAKNFQPLDIRCDPALIRRNSRLGGSIEFYLGR